MIYLFIGEERLLISLISSQIISLLFAPWKAQSSRVSKPSFKFKTNILILHTMQFRIIKIQCCKKPVCFISSSDWDQEFDVSPVHPDSHLLEKITDTPWQFDAIPRNSEAFVKLKCSAFSTLWWISRQCWTELHHNVKCCCYFVHLLNVHALFALYALYPKQNLP